MQSSVSMSGFRNNHVLVNGEIAEHFKMAFIQKTLPKQNSERNNNKEEKRSIQLTS